MRKRFRRPSPALAISLIALFVAMGGTSYGLARNSIDSREIRNNDVRSSDIRNNDVRSKDVRNGSLLSKDFKAGQLPAGPRGATGPGGPAGPRGLTGQGGPQGGPGISGLQRVVGASDNNLSQSGKTATATCPGTKKVIGSGAELLGDISDGTFPNQIQNVVISAIGIDPASPPKFVQVRAQETNATAGDWFVVAYAICANVAP